MNPKSAYDQALELLCHGYSKGGTRWFVQADNKLLTADEISETVERAAEHKRLKDRSIERAREDATAQFIRGNSPSRIYNWLCKYYTDLSKETIAQITGYTPPVETFPDPDYLLKVVKQPNGWYVYTPNCIGPFIFTESKQLTAFVNDYLSFDVAKAEKLSNLKAERDKLDAHIKELEA